MENGPRGGTWVTLGGVQGPGHRGPVVMPVLPGAPAELGHPGGAAHLWKGPGSTALPPWKRHGSANPWQHTPPHGNPPAHGNASAAASTRTQPRSPRSSGAPRCAGPWRDAPGAPAGTPVTGVTLCAHACGCWQPPGLGGTEGGWDGFADHSIPGGDTAAGWLRSQEDMRGLKVSSSA